MGHRLPQRRKGKGTTTYRSPSNRFKAKTSFRTYDDKEKNGIINGEIIDLIDDPARNSPVMIVRFPDSTIALPAPLGVMTGNNITAGINASVNNGNYLPLKKIPEGTLVSNVELIPGDGGKIARTAGSKVRIISKDKNGVMLQLSSRKYKIVNEDCRAMIGIIAGGGHKVKPLYKAGKRMHKRKAKNLPWPSVRGCARNAVDHPHGGKQKRLRKNW